VTIGEDILNETQQRAMRNISARRRKPMTAEERQRSKQSWDQSYLGGIVNKWDQDTRKTAQQYERGEITIGEEILRDTAAGINAVFTPVSDVTGAVLSTADETLLGGAGGRSLEAAGEYLSETDAGEALIEYIQENPRTAENIMAAIDVAGVIPIARIVKSGINRPAAEVKTLLEGFYGAGVGSASKGAAAAQGLAEALPSSMLNAFKPSAIAYERVTGIPKGKSKDITELQQEKNILLKEKEGKTTYVVDTDGKRHILNSNKMKRDKLGRDFIEDKDTGELKRLVAEKKIVDRPKGDRIGAAFTAESIAQQRGAKPGTTIIGEGPLGVVDEIAVIQANNTAEVSRQLFSKGVNVGYDVPDAVKNKHLDHVYKVWGVNKNKTDIKIKNPEGPTSQLSTEARLGNEKIPKATPLKALGVKGKVTLVAKKNKPNLKADGLSEWAKNQDIEVKDLKKKHIKAYYGYLNGQLEKAGEKKRFRLEDNNDGFLHISDSHGSREKELGGVNDMISIHPESGNIYTTISDQHDMFGINPLGGKGLVAVTPTQKSNFKTDVKFDVEDNLNKKETLAKMEEAADFIEQKYKVPREKNENAVTYHMRVLGEIDPKANIKDYANVARRAGMLTGVTQSTLGAEQEEQTY
tara:strand:+ start:5270 stop:7180 length:1911 start_codon:yes stop_codon:yes gene_type:complete